MDSPAATKAQAAKLQMENKNQIAENKRQEGNITATLPGPSNPSTGLADGKIYYLIFAL